MSVWLLIPTVLIAGMAAYHALRRLFRELEDAFDLPRFTDHDTDD